MATSGTRTFDLDVAEIIEEAYERCGLEVRSGYDAATARRSMNLMLAEWANRGVNLWTVEKGTATVTSGTETITLGADVVDVLDVSLRRDSSDFELNRISRSNYSRLTNKATSGRPTQFWLDKGIPPVLYLWPMPNNSTDQVLYYYARRIEDAGALANTTAVAFRFLPALVAGLAYYLAVKKAPERVQLLKAMYEEEYQRAVEEDDDRVSLYLLPDMRGC